MHGMNHMPLTLEMMNSCSVINLASTLLQLVLDYT